MIKFFKKKNPCNAPISSMRLNHSGNAIACCYNRGYILGKFPDQSLSEIWFGENVKKIQKAIGKSDFSLGCQNCEKHINSGNREISGAFQYDYLSNYEQTKKYPTMLDLELGSTCNFECIMCSGEYSSAIRVNREKKKAYYSPYEEHVDDFIEQLKPFLPHLKEIRFLGGEPFLMKIYYRIWEEVIIINPQILLSVLTNASILNDRVKSTLKKGNFKISVSIDSIEKASFESIRKNSNFELVMKNVSFFHDLMIEKGYQMDFNVCVMRQNWREIPAYFDYCNQNKIKVNLHSVMFPAHTALWNLPKAILNEVVSEYNAYVFKVEENNLIAVENNRTFENLTIQVQNWSEKAADETDFTFDHLIEALHIFETENRILEESKTRLKQLLNPYGKQEQTKILNFFFKLGYNRLHDELEISSDERISERFKTLLISS